MPQLRQAVLCAAALAKSKLGLDQPENLAGSSGTGDGGSAGNLEQGATLKREGTDTQGAGPQPPQETFPATSHQARKDLPLLRGGVKTVTTKTPLLSSQRLECCGAAVCIGFTCLSV